MKTLSSLPIFFLLAVLTSAFSFLAPSHPIIAQRARPAKVTALQATSDKTGQHPATATVAGPEVVTCLNAVSETPNARPEPGCHTNAPGFNGNVAKGKTANVTAAGTVTLTCTGPGYLRCDARIG